MFIGNYSINCSLKFIVHLTYNYIFPTCTPDVSALRESSFIGELCPDEIYQQQKKTNNHEIAVLANKRRSVMMTNRAHVLQGSSHGDGWSGGSRGGCGFGSSFLRGGVRCRSVSSSNSSLHSPCNKLLCHKRWGRIQHIRDGWAEMRKKKIGKENDIRDPPTLSSLSRMLLFSSFPTVL